MLSPAGGDPNLRGPRVPAPLPALRARGAHQGVRAAAARLPLAQPRQHRRHVRGYA